MNIQGQAALAIGGASAVHVWENPKSSRRWPRISSPTTT
jgi:hypothetical protein